ncbi:unnamed protein product [Brachionus calyciflorus]|uniref:EGF-like domain-containing protein n=1 Tax=Brachionus calyciflorus TaxID=104777 RepID=A0A813V4H4_9BILA|nr:unnamed protein product [Brachionus calyciflorus]
MIFEVNYKTRMCPNKECKNSASCVIRGKTYDCLCPIGYFGRDCSLIISNYTCQTNHFYSFKQKLCVPCPGNLTSDNRYPFKCFFESNTLFNYSQAVIECAKLGLTLIRPKSLNERQMILSRFGNRNRVDSIITQLGDTYFWGDGTKVYGFAINEPNNSGESHLVQNNLFTEGCGLNDSSESDTAKLLCEYTDSNENLYY